MSVTPSPTAFSPQPRFGWRPGKKAARAIRIAGAALAVTTVLGVGNEAQNLYSGSCRPFYSPVQISHGPDTFTPISRKIPTTAEGVMAELKKHTALHAINSPGRWEYFEKNGNFTMADFDIQLDERGRVVMAHDKPDYLGGTDFDWHTKSRVDTLVDRLDAMEKLPPGKVVMVKMDIKDTGAYEQIIPLLEKHRHLFDDKILIINEGFDRVHPQNDPRVAAVKQIKSIIPATVVSIGVGMDEDVSAPGFTEGMERVMNALGKGDVYTLPIFNEQIVSPELFDWMDAHNTFMTLWAQKTSLTCEPGQKEWVSDAYKGHIPVEYQDRFWAEFNEKEA